MEFTKSQERAIEEHGSNILVSAAAGSGKTAVLVERIIRELTASENPVDIDRILVMTFTKAAAGEMKERILGAINDALLKDPHNRHLLRQSSLIHNAHISTIHGFCLEVIRNHFHAISLSPDFRSADDAEASLLQQDALSEVLEEAYEIGDEAFINMTEHVAPKKSDTSMTEAIMRIYRFAISSPDVEKWYDDCLCAYQDVKTKEFDSIPLVIQYVKQTKERLRNIYNQMEALYELTLIPGGPYMYSPCMEDELNRFEMYEEISSYDQLRSFVQAYTFGKLGTAKKTGMAEPDENLKKRIQDSRKALKDSMGSLRKELQFDAKQTADHMIKCADDIAALIKITRAFNARYDDKKRKRNVIDFNDMEHFCLRILTDNPIIAAEYREYFKEIYVDEYQDSNLVQEAIVNAIEQNNVFMVGDVKQSIYRFRMARPELFLGKYHSYADGTSGVRIDLSDNFRSSRSVVNAVNEVFEEIMKPEVGGIAYDDAAKLYFGANCYADSVSYPAELVAICEDASMNRRELEALCIANRIHDLVNAGTIIYDKEAKINRPIKYSDIVILLRAGKGWDNTFRDVLSMEGIPVHVDSSIGYFSAQEVMTILDYLRIIDNPLQDIPLSGVLMSPIGHFDAAELAVIRSRYKKMPLYHALLEAVGEKHVFWIREELAGESAAESADNQEDGLDEVLLDKIRSFLDRLSYFRAKEHDTSVHELLREIIDGEYGYYVSAMPEGEKKMANLNMLLKRAREYGKMSFKGLFRFVRYIEYLKKSEIDYGEAGVGSENDNTVRIMSIHKSKGLEFPVCILAGMQKKFNFNDANAALVMDADYGIGITLVDEVRRTKKSTLARNYIAQRLRQEALAEELRILYVAMTRAREKLIMTAVIKEDKADLSTDISLQSAANYLDLLLYARKKKGDFAHIKTEILTISDLIRHGMREELSMQGVCRSMMDKLDATDSPIDSRAFDSDLMERLAYSYRFDPADHFAKVSVTELKKKSMAIAAAEAAQDSPDASELYEEPVVIPYIPAFMSEETGEASPTLHGTAFHRFLEIWDYRLNRSIDEVERYIDKARTNGRMEEELLSRLYPRELMNFLESDLAERMEKAALLGQLYREQPFVLKDESNMLVQGIIDAFFIEDGQIVVVDYKTDRVKSPSELVERYHVQLEYYEKALMRLMKLPVREKIIYSSALRMSIPVN